MPINMKKAGLSLKDVGLSKFKVSVSRKVTQVMDLNVYAGSKKEARKAALEMARSLSFAGMERSADYKVVDMSKQEDP